MRQRTTAHADQLARARLAYLSAGQPSLTAPRHALEEPEPEDLPAQPDQVASRPRRELTRTHLVALATVALVAVLVVAFTWSRASAETVTAPAPAPVAAPLPPDEGPSPAPSISPLRVHVLGGVVSPGVVTVEPGAIVADVIAAAGGLAPQALPGELNLAAPVADGMQVVVGSDSQPSRVEGQPVSGSGGGSSGGKVDLNTASREELETLPGVGPVMAEAIVAWREEHGQFSSTAELQEVSGIGPKTFAKLEPLVTV